MLADHCPLTAVREILESNKTHNTKLWNQLANMGLLGAAIPEKYGGTNMNMLELCVIAEELGRALAPVPFSSSIYVAAETLKATQNENAKKHWLPKLASGEAIGTFAFSEKAGAPTFANTNTAFDGHKLSGTKMPVPDGMSANFVITTAKNKKDQAVIILADANTPNVKRQNVRTIDPSRKYATITFHDAPAEILAEGDKAEEMMDRILNRSAVLFAFEQLGGADAALEMAQTYARERFAFGRPIGSFQAIKHKLANIYVKNQLARSNCYYAAMTLGSQEESADLAIAAATARISASDAFIFAAQENVQTHGGIGFTWESDCQLFYRRARTLSLVIGAQRRWKERLVRLLEMKNVA